MANGNTRAGSAASGTGGSHPFLDAGREVVIAEAVRTPIGRSHPEKGYFRDTHPNVMLGVCYGELLERTGVPPADVEDLIVGCTAQFGEQSRNIARNAWLQAGYPPEVPAMMIDRRCGSAQSSVAMGAAQIASGMADVVIAGGVEHMHHVPITSPAKISEFFGTPWPQELLDRYDFVHQGESAELIAEQWSISREEMEELAVRSHRLAHEATEEGRFAREIVPIDVGDGALTADQGIRPGTNLESLAQLKTPFRDEGGRITAGLSSQISDGAAAVLLVSRAACERYGLAPRARIFDQVSVGVDPITMLTGPIPATRKLLERNGLQMSDVDLTECNEAFASVVLAWARELEPDMDTVNVNGGAMALGHPVGTTGSRLTATLLHELERRGDELGLVTMCCGGGLGTGTLIQRL